jgi:hypothetical protein
MDARLEARWYVNEDDLIGGWDIGTQSVPASQSHAAENVAWGLHQEIAEHIVALHNAAQQQPPNDAWCVGCTPNTCSGCGDILGHSLVGVTCTGPRCQCLVMAE